MRLKNNNPLSILFAIVLLLLFNSCYSFKGISIPSDVKTFYVENIDLTDLDAPADLNQTFAEALRDKIRNESRLSYTEVDPHVVFSGVIHYYHIDAVAQVEGSTTALNRLEIKLKINYENQNDEEKNWESNFGFFEDFDANADLTSIQEDLIDNIITQLTEKIFNKAFTDW